MADNDQTHVYDTNPPKSETTEAPKSKTVKAKAQSDLGAQVPSIGRIVVFNHQEGDEVNPLAAMVTNVSKISGGILVVNLCVFDAFGSTFGVQGIKQGDGAGEWNWPVRV